MNVARLRSLGRPAATGKCHHRQAVICAVNVFSATKPGIKNLQVQYSTDPMDRWLREQLCEFCEEAMDWPLSPQVMTLTRELEQVLDKSCAAIAE